MESPALTPRPITAAGRRQSWRELPVRKWFVMTLALVVVIASVGINALATGLRDRRLLNEGVLVNAKIESIAGGMYKQDRSVQREVSLSFLIPGETEPRTLEKQKLEASANAKPISKGDTLQIWVDKKDPRKWTDRLTPVSWLVVMAVPLLLTPPAIVLALITAAVRRRLLNIYANGTQRSANVDDAHHSPLVPGQKVVKFSVAGRALAAAYPDRLGTIASGDTIDVIVDDENKPSHAVIANAYA